MGRVSLIEPGVGMTLRAVPPPMDPDDPGFLPEDPPSHGGPVLRGTTDQDVALEVIRTLTEKYGTEPVFADGSLWRYDGAGLWEKQDDVDLRNLICSWNGTRIVDAFGSPKVRKDGTPVVFPGNQKNAESAMKRMYDLTRNDAFFESAQSGVMFQDKFVRVTPAGDVEAVDPSPDCRARFRINAPYPSDPEAQPVKYMEALYGAFYGDSEACIFKKMALIQEWTGLAMIGRSPNARALMLVGPERSGKSVTAKVALGVFPTSARASIPLKSLDPGGAGGGKAEYYLAKLAGVRINADLDLPGGAFVGGENFKKIVTGEGMSGRHPSGRVFDFIPQAAMLFAGESLPVPEDKNRGFFRRWIVIRYHNQVDPRSVKQNYEESILREERAVIAAWFIRGAAASIKRGGFDIPPEVESEIPKWVLDSDPAAQWCEMFCIPTPNTPQSQWPTTAAFHVHFTQWCRSNGYKEKASNTFGRDLKRCLLNQALRYEDRNGVMRWGYRYQPPPMTQAQHDDDIGWPSR